MAQIPDSIIDKAVREEHDQAARLYRFLRRERNFSRAAARGVIAWQYDYDDPEGGIFWT